MYGAAQLPFLHICCSEHSDATVKADTHGRVVVCNADGTLDPVGCGFAPEHVLLIQLTSVQDVSDCQHKIIYMRITRTR